MQSWQGFEAYHYLHITTRALSFGQDEGQFEVSEPVWGIYVDDRRRYKIQLEGRCQAAR